MFGISFTELVLILVVALVVLGPQRLPGMLRTIGLWIHKVRRMTTEVRAQTGIDDLLRQEGFTGGLAEVRSLLRGDPRALIHSPGAIESINVEDPYARHAIEIDASRERPLEGPDSYGALPDDLVDEEALRRVGSERVLHQLGANTVQSGAAPSNDPHHSAERIGPDSNAPPTAEAPVESSVPDHSDAAPTAPEETSGSSTGGPW